MYSNKRNIYQIYFIANEEELKILREENARDTKFSMFFYTCVFTTAILALVSPFVIAVFYYIKGQGFRENLEPALKAT